MTTKFINGESKNSRPTGLEAHFGASKYENICRMSKIKTAFERKQTTDEVGRETHM